MKYYFLHNTIFEKSLVIFFYLKKIFIPKQSPDKSPRVDKSIKKKIEKNYKRILKFQKFILEIFNAGDIFTISSHFAITSGNGWTRFPENLGEIRFSAVTNLVFIPFLGYFAKIAHMRVLRMRRCRMEILIIL